MISPVVDQLSNDYSDEPITFYKVRRSSVIALCFDDSTSICVWSIHLAGWSG